MTKKNKTEEFKLDRNGTPCFVIFENLDEYEDKGANVVVINSIYYDEKKTKNRVAELQKNIWICILTMKWKLGTHLDMSVMK